MTTIPVTQAPTAPTTTTAPDQTFGILSLVSSIVALVAGLFPVASIVAIVLGGIALQREPGSRKLATAGILIGAIPLAIGMLFLVTLPLGLLGAFGLGAFGWDF